MVEKTLISATVKQCYFDKLTGHNFLFLLSIDREGIQHHRFKSEVTGDTILLSDSGIKLRFNDKPNIGSENIKNLFRQAA